MEISSGEKPKSTKCDINILGITVSEWSIMKYDWLEY